MPWNQDDGGQGPWGQSGGNNGSGQNEGSSGQGPWSGDRQRQQRGPQRPGGGGSGLPPDLDDLLKRGSDRFKNAIPSGGGGMGSWLLPLALAGAFWLYNSLYQIQPDERGVVLRLGEYSRTVEPGLHFAFWPVERIEKPRVGALRTTEVNSDDSMLTSDKNILNVDFTVFYKINDAQDYLFNVAEQEKLVLVISQSAMREVVGQNTAQNVLTTGKDAVAAQVAQIAQQHLDAYKSGLTITNVNLSTVKPPEEVADAFNEVNRADQDKKKFENEAQQYRNQQLQKVEGEAAKMIEDASAYKARVVAEAQGEAARFLSVYDQYKNAKDVTRQRIFLETMEDVLSKSNKVIVQGGQNGSGVVPYLPLPEIQKRAKDGAAQPQN
jgi:modulator of FtsH protease HflK